MPSAQKLLLHCTLVSHFLPVAHKPQEPPQSEVGHSRPERIPSEQLAHFLTEFDPVADSKSSHLPVTQSVFRRQLDPVEHPLAHFPPPSTQLSRPFLIPSEHEMQRPDSEHC